MGELSGLRKPACGTLALAAALPLALVIIGQFGGGSGNSSGHPSPTPSTAAVTSPSSAASGIGGADMAQLTALPSGVTVYDYTNNAVSSADRNRDALDVLRSLGMERVGLSRPDVTTFNSVYTEGGAATVYGVDLAPIRASLSAGRAVTPSGTPTVIAVGVYQLTDAQKQAMAEITGETQPKVALMVTVRGPVTVSVGGDAVTEVIDGTDNLLIAGSQSTFAGHEYWHISYVQRCSAGDPSSSLICSGV